jgi:hypothetical protein
MVKIASAPNVFIAQHWINILEHAGVPCEMHNRYLHGALGEIPMEQCAPEIWVADDRDEQLARRLIEAAIHGPQAGERRWRCAYCRETLEPQFTVCWQCGTARDPLDDEAD